MKKLRFVYKMQLDFDADVANHYFILRCKPKNGDGQRLYGYELSLGAKDECALCEDSFGNEYFSGRRMAAHRGFHFESSGVVWTDFSHKNAPFQPLYRYASPYTKCGAEMARFFKENRRENAAPFVQAQHFMQEIYASLTYTKGVTDVSTAAEGALTLRQGVCQDYAHILLALCRRAGFAAKYVAGLMIGEGSSHAWVEVWQDGVWRGFDPTNNCLVSEDYIKFAEGRDFGDCLLNRGIFSGAARQSQQIYANVEEIL